MLVCVVVMIVGNSAWRRASHPGTSMVSDSRSKLVILGIGDDGLAGLTEPRRRRLMAADLILGAPCDAFAARVGAQPQSRPSSPT